MATLKDAALSYEGKQTKNIAELPKVSTSLVVNKKEFTKEDGTVVKIDITTVDGVEYRVPASVLKALKAILEENPNLRDFKVKRTGQGLDTSYTVIPLS